MTFLKYTVGACSLLLVCLAGCEYFQSEPESPEAEPVRPSRPVVAAPLEPEPEPDIPTVGESIELKLSESVSLEQCAAKFIALGNGRPAVLQLSSYVSAGTEKFPSVHLRAMVSAETPLALKGMELDGSMHVQYEKDGPLWYSEVESPIKLRIAEVDEGRIEVELVGGTLVNSQTGEAIAASGELTGAFR